MAKKTFFNGGPKAALKRLYILYGLKSTFFSYVYRNAR
jgi:hypothetical protein